jgi:hypothetical protein
MHKSRHYYGFYSPIAIPVSNGGRPNLLRNFLYHKPTFGPKVAENETSNFTISSQYY